MYIGAASYHEPAPMCALHTPSAESIRRGRRSAGETSSHAPPSALSGGDHMTRTVAELWAMWQPRAKVDVYPFDFAPYEAVERAMTSLTSVLDREAWAAAFSAEAAPYEQRARDAAARDDRAGARQHCLEAYALYRMARFPCMNSPGKQAAYRKSQ